MIRYTLVYSREALDASANEWLNASDRQVITTAGDEIERQLSVDAHDKGQNVREGLRKLVVPPLLVQFTAAPDDRVAVVWSVRVVESGN